MFNEQTGLIMSQVNDVLRQISDEEYMRPLDVFNGSSIGQHTRHLIEFFQELERGYVNGVVDYDSRKRNKEIETNKAAAIAHLENITLLLKKPDRLLQLNPASIMDGSGDNIITTTYFRELYFVLEHAVHHLALIRIGIEQFHTVLVPTGFGIATSTQHYHNKCAQ